MVDAFKNLLAMAETSHATILEKNSKAQEAWKRVVGKMDVWKRQKFTLCTQIQCMKSGRQHLLFNPSPLPNVFTESDVSLILISNVLILPCSFCLGGFAPSWDYKFSSCKHPYHFWCAFSHFSTFSKCLHCEKEMHANWWTLFGINKPSSKEEKAKEENLGLLGITLEGT